MKTFSQKIVAVGAGMFLAANMAVYGDILYSDSTTDTHNNLSLVNDTKLGNEIIMGNPSPFNTLTSFSFEIFSTQAVFSAGANVKMQVFLFANDGTPYNTYPTPSTLLYDSGVFSLLTPQQSGFGNAATLNFDLSAAPITVPHDFTFAVEVTGLAANDLVGMELFDPATVGQNSGDYWLSNSVSGWQLDRIAGTRTDFGARFLGSAVPDAAPTAMLLGMALASLGFLRRKFC